MIGYLVLIYLITTVEEKPSLNDMTLYSLLFLDLPSVLHGKEKYWLGSDFGRKKNLGDNFRVISGKVNFFTFKLLYKRLWRMYV